MKLFENGVGRPSNETLKKRRMFIVSVAILIVAIIFVWGYILNGLNISNLTGETRKVDVSLRDPYKPGTELELSKVKIYSSSKIKFSLIRKSGTYYIWSNEVENGRIRITKDSKGVGNKKKITGWIDVSVINKTSTSTDTSDQLLGDVNLNGKLDTQDYKLVLEYVSKKKELSKEQLNNADMNKDGKVNAVDAKLIQSELKKSTTKAVTYKKRDKVTLKSANIYKTATAKKESSKKSGTVYIYSSAQSNGRIRISLTKNGKAIGWVNVSDIKKLNKITYKKYKYNPVYMNHCYTEESVLKNNYEVATNVKVGDRVYCPVTLETDAGDKVVSLNYTLKYGKGLKLVGEKYVDKKSGNNYSFALIKPASVYEWLGHFTFEVVDTEDITYGLNNIKFVTENKDYYYTDDLSYSLSSN